MKYYLNILFITILFISQKSIAQQDSILHLHKNKLHFDSTSLALKDSSIVDIPSDSNKFKNTVPIQNSSNGPKQTVYYSSNDSIRTNLLKKKATLYGNAKIKYENFELKAEEIDVFWASNEVGARGKIDSTGKYIGRPVFKQGEETFVTDSMRYNIKTEKAIIYGIETKQGEGYLQGDTAKKVGNNTYLKNGIYTTCDLKHPHFYIKARKLKIVENKKAICGPFNIVLEDIPTPLGFYMGMFPFMDNKKSGIIMPQINTTNQNGMGFKDGGYFWAMNDYIHFTFLTSLYSNGSWLTSNKAVYAKRYQYNGNLFFSYGSLKQGFNPDPSPKQFALNWNHQTIANKPGKIQAKVNINSTKYDKYTSLDPQLINGGNKNSDINYTRVFPRTPFSTTITARADQNLNSVNATNLDAPGLYTVHLPQASINMNSIAPLKNLGTKNEAWYKKLFLTYSAGTDYSFTNKIRMSDPFNPNNEIDSVFRINDTTLREVIIPNGVWGANHSAQIRSPFKALKYLNITPAINYQEYWYAKELVYEWDDSLRKSIVTDTLNNFNRAFEYNANINMTTSLYGMIQFRGDRTLKAVRHTLRPSVGFTFAPDFSDGPYKGWQTIAEDTAFSKEGRKYYTYLGKNQTPSNGRKSLDITLQSIVEAKLRDKKDTTGENPYRKVNVIENFQIRGGYNFQADSIKLSNIDMVLTTKIFKKINVSLNTTHDAYRWVADSSYYSNERLVLVNHRKTNQFLYNYNNKFASLSRLSLNLSTSLAPKKKGLSQTPTPANDAQQRELNHIKNHPEQYVDFSIPWSLNLNYSLNYTKEGLNEKDLNSSLTLRGDLKLTNKWRIDINSGYNFQDKSITTTNIGILRDLHCWEMRATVLPIGTYKSYTFTINAKSSMLQQLKLTRRSPSNIY